MAVAGELAVARERLDTLERLLENKGVLDRGEIETFVPTEAQAGERQAWHAEYIARVMRIVHQELEALEDPEGDRPLGGDRRRARPDVMPPTAPPEDPAAPAA